MTTAKNTNKKSAAVETTIETAAKESRSKQEIFEASLNKVRTTGNPAVDAVARKVITAIHSGELVMTGDREHGFSGNYNGKAKITVVRHVMQSKIANKNETARYVLTIGEGKAAIDITGAFAAKSFAFSNSQNRPAGTPVYNSEVVAAVAALLD